MRGDQQRLGAWAGEGGGGELSGDDRGSLRSDGGVEVLGVIYENQAVARGGLEAGDAGDGDRGVSEKMAAEFFGEGAQGLAHGCLLSRNQYRVASTQYSVSRGRCERRRPPERKPLRG